MRVAIKKWGNSLALRIPKDVAQSLHLEKDSLAELQIKDGSPVIEPVSKIRLEDLVSRIDPENLHGEIETGEAVGNEAW